MGANNSNYPPSNSAISNSSNSTEKAINNNDTLPKHNLNNQREIIDLTVEDCESEDEEDSIINLDMTNPSSKALWPKNYADSNWTCLDVLSKFNFW